jgi:membrane protein implicated in regulation of membrane protease activity
VSAAAFDPWVWAAIAVALGIAEMLIPGYVLLGFAASAVLMALGLALIPIAVAPTLQSLFVLLILWAALALLAWWALSRLLGARIRSRSADDDDDVNDFSARM